METLISHVILNRGKVEGQNQMGVNKG